MHRVKLYTAIFLFFLLLLFTIQNMGRVELTFLFWSFETRRFAMIGLCFLAGCAVGWIAKSLVKKNQEDGL